MYGSKEPINNRWGVAVCCDGAGSKINSHHGAKFVAEQCAKILAHLVKAEQWHTRNQLPDNEASWHQLSKEALGMTYKLLIDYVKNKALPLDSLACTVIAVIYSPIGLLISHIGDGRAAYCDSTGKWLAMMKPFKGGEYANETVFITSTYVWQDMDRFIQSRMITEKPSGFSLMSDGCERFAYQTYINTSKKEGEIKVLDLNTPFDSFYTYVTQRLSALHKLGDSGDAISAEWRSILEDRTETIQNEPDDKTMILGLWL